MSAGTVSSAIVWQDVECGSYTADLPLWERLAEDCGGPLLELGCGCGRVALHLARLGHSVAGVDTDPELIRELARRASEAEVDLRAERADAAGFGLGESYRLIIAPMQLFQLLPGPAQRRDCLAAVAAHLEPGGTAAIAIVEGSAAGVPPPRRSRRPRARRLGLLEPSPRCDRGWRRVAGRAAAPDGLTRRPTRRGPGQRPPAGALGREAGGRGSRCRPAPGGATGNRGDRDARRVGRRAAGGG